MSLLKVFVSLFTFLNAEQTMTRDRSKNDRLYVVLAKKIAERKNVFLE